MFTKEIMDTFSELDFAVYDCIINNRERVSSMSTVIVSSKSSTRSIWKEKGTL